MEGPLSEVLLDTLSEGKDGLAELIEGHRKETKERKKQLALQQREKMLKSMGFSVASPEQGGKITASSKVAGVEELEDDQGFTCIVCREGYKYKPKDMFGIYVFSKKVDVTLGGLSLRQEKCYSTVTHFNWIHYKCHAQATRAERSGKHSKEEWEGATLRNSDTKCNNLFPVAGPEISDADFHDNLEYHFNRLTEISSLSSPRFRLVTQDLRGLFFKLAYEESFSVDTHGGGRESNVKLIPFMVQLGLAVLLENPAPTYEGALASFLTEKEDKWYPTHLEPDDACLAMVTALFLRTPSFWAQSKSAFLTRILLLAHRRHVITNSAVDVVGKPADFFKSARPLLLFYFLISETFVIFAPIEKKQQGEAPAAPNQVQQDPKGKGKAEDSYPSALRWEIRHNAFSLLPKFTKVTAPPPPLLSISSNNKKSHVSL